MCSSDLTITRWAAGGRPPAAAPARGSYEARCCCLGGGAAARGAPARGAGAWPLPPAPPRCCRIARLDSPGTGNIAELYILKKVQRGCAPAGWRRHIRRWRRGGPQSLASGTTGGAVAPTTWTVAPFNTSSGNTATDVRLAAAPAGLNQFLIADGTYEVHARCIMCRAGPFKLRLRNVSDSTIELYGSSEFNIATSNSSNTTATASRIIGALTVSGGPKIYQFELYKTGTVNDPTNMGYPMSVSPYPEVYNYAIFAKQMS